MRQFIKFGIVGLFNSILNYVIYVGCIKVRIHYVMANIIGFLIVIFIAFLLQNYIVFRDEAGRVQQVWWKVLIKTYMSYAFTGLVLNNLLSIFWLEVVNLEVVIRPLYLLTNGSFQWKDERIFAEYIVPFFNIILQFPVNFAINKYWTYRHK